MRLIAGALLNTSVYGALLFLPAGTFAWWRAWVLLGVLCGAMIAARLFLIGNDGGLFAERRKPPLQQGQPPADKLLVVAFLVVVPAYIMFIPVDVFRLHLIEHPDRLVSIGGLALVIAGSIVIALAFRENSFAAAIVKHQDDRGQAVIDRGVYSVVRHPLYVGVAIVIIGSSLWLESYAAAVASIVPIVLLLIRIHVEEQFLTARLAGYEAYTKRVRTRLIPWIW